MLRVVAWVLTVWVAWRWLGFLRGFIRMFGFEPGPVRSEARREVVGRGAYNVLFTVVAVYLWADVWDAELGEAFVGFLAAAMTCSVAIGIASRFMQPQERTRATVGICSVLPMLEPESSEPAS